MLLNVGSGPHRPGYPLRAVGGNEDELEVLSGSDGRHGSGLGKVVSVHFPRAHTRDSAGRSPV